MPDDLKRISGLWVKDGRKGKFFSGQTDADVPAGAKLLIFRNDKKTSDSQPDYVLYIAPDDAQCNSGSPRRQPASAPARSQQRPAPPQQPQAPSTPPDPRPPLDDSEIPF